MELLVQIRNLAIVEENEKAIAFERSDGFGKLLLPIQHGAGPDSVKDSLGFFRLNQPLEHFVFRGIKPRDLLLHSQPDDLAESQVRSIELKRSSDTAFTGTDLIVQRQRKRHTPLSDRQGSALAS